MYLSLLKRSIFFIIICFCLNTNSYSQNTFQNGNSIVGIGKYQGMKSDITPSKQKLSFDLLQLIDQKFLPAGTLLEAHIESMNNLKQFRSAGANFSDPNILNISDVYVYIKLQPNMNSDLLIPLLKEVTDVDNKNNMFVAWVQVNNLEKIASLNIVRNIRTVMPPIVRTGSVTTEGDGIHKTSDVRSTYSQSGSGMKVGIISDGVDTRSAAQATGDLPADGSGLTVLSNSVGGDEGTAMLEIVHDMVPAADLYFHDCGNNVTAFNNAITDLVNAGCDVICDDIGWLLEPFFEDGTVASHVASVLSDNDVIYVSSAGNAGNKHYQGDYYPIPSSTQHDFSRNGTDYYLYCNIPSGSDVIGVLQWNDLFGASGNDYDLLLYSFSLGGVVAASTITQDGDDDPLEYFVYTATVSSAGDFAIIVDKWSGSTKTLEVYLYPGGSAGIYTNNITPVDAIFGHPAVVGAVAVGAVDVATPSTIENFSSQGPCTISYPSSVSRAKPDIVGTNGGIITGAGSFGFWDGLNWRFNGTSASAPHVAAVCAQLWAQLSSDTGDDIRDMVLNTAVNLGTAGFDYVFGWGRADALEAFDTYVFVDAPSFNPVAGTYSPPQDITISTTTPSATIHYTLDGSDPTTGDPTSSPVQLIENTTLKARAYRTGWNESTITSGYYDLGCWTQTHNVTGTGSYTFNADGDGHEVDMNFTSLSGSGDVVNQQNTTAPANAPCINVCDFYWDISESGITSFSVDMTFHYTASDVSGYTESEAYLGIAKFNASTNTWVWLGGTVNDGANTVTVSGVSSLSIFALFRRIFGDITDDGYVDAADLQRLGDCWHDTNTGEFSGGTDARFFNFNKNTDAGGDQIIDAGDLQVFGDCWHNGIEPPPP